MRGRLAFLVVDVVPRNLLTTLRQRDLARAADLIQVETGLALPTAAEGQRVSGTTHRRSLQVGERQVSAWTERYSGST